MQQAAIYSNIIIQDPHLPQCLSLHIHTAKLQQRVNLITYRYIHDMFLATLACNAMLL